jgi:CBS domain-containing protein
MSVKTKALAEKLVHVTRTKPVTVLETAKLGAVLALMREKKVHCVMVCKGKKLTGVFTERDYLNKALGKAKSSEPISKYMTPKPLTAYLEETLGEVIEVMNQKGLRNLPLVGKGGEPASLVTVNTIIRYLADHFPAEVVNRPPQPHLVSEETDGA